MEEEGKFAGHITSRPKNILITALGQRIENHANLVNQENHKILCSAFTCVAYFLILRPADKLTLKNLIPVNIGLSREIC